MPILSSPMGNSRVLGAVKWGASPIYRQFDLDMFLDEEKRIDNFFIIIDKTFI